MNVPTHHERQFMQYLRGSGWVKASMTPGGAMLIENLLAESLPALNRSPDCELRLPCYLGSLTKAQHGVPSFQMICRATCLKRLNRFLP
jgi:hypothetical protein